MKKCLAIILAALMTLSLAACGGSGSSTTTTAGGETTTSGGETTTAEKTDGEVTVVIAGNKPVVNNLDHYQNKGSESGTLEGLWGDSLIYKVNDDFFPVLAESYEWDDDHMGITFVLKQGIKFTNGEEMTAEDVKVSFERILNSDLCITGSSVQASLEEVEVIDDYTCHFKFKAAYPGFMGDVCGTQIICASAFNESDPAEFFQNPVATGPFKVDKYDPVTGDLELVRNTEWWGWGNDELAANFEVDNSAESKIDRVIYKQSSEIASKIAGLEAGDYNFIEDITVEYFAELEGKGLKTYSVDRLQMVYFGFNQSTIFSDPNLRKAVSLAIDRDSIVSDIYGSGYAATTPVSAITVGFNEDAAYEYDPDKAAELVKASSYNGEEIVLKYTSGCCARSSEIVQAIQAMLTAAGFNVTVTAEESATFETDIKEGNYDLMMFSFLTASGNPYKLFNEYYLNGGNYGTNCQDDKLDELINTALSTTDDDEYAVACQEALDYAQENEISISGLFVTSANCASSANFSGMTLHPQNGWIAKYITVD